MYTKKEMEDCFEAGVKFGRDMFNNPSNSEYIEEIATNKGQELPIHNVSDPLLKVPYKEGDDYHHETGRAEDV
ncbi:hypothetical protein KAR91_70810 [Candidatus Pacearchaeota archaeon]|nr:hypothetical protein [Candidatus Pacearchaeota archaeon]